MKKKVRPDYSVRLNLEGVEDLFPDGVLVSPRYDHIQRFPWLGAAILRCATQEGIAHMLIDLQTADRIVQAAQLPIAEMEFICETDYEMYLKSQVRMLDDSWLSEPDETEGWFDDPS